MLAHALREMRLKRGLSVEQLSKRSGVREWIIREIDPSYVPSEGNTARLAEALRVPVGSLLTERDCLIKRFPH